MYMLQAQRTMEVNITAELNAYRQEREQRRKLKEEILQDKHRREILDALGNVNPENTFNQLGKLRHAGTGIWFLKSEEFINWRKTSNIGLWMYGIRE